MITVNSYDFIGFCQWLVSNEFIEGKFAKLPGGIQDSLITRYQQISKLRLEHDEKPLLSKYLHCTGVRQSGRVIRFDELVDRFRSVPCHALFVYTSEDENLVSYLRKNMLALDGMSGETCDIYTSKLQVSNQEDAYTQANVLQSLPFFATLLPNQLPLLHIWTQDAGLTISLVNFTDRRHLTEFLREVFTFLQTINGALSANHLQLLKSMETQYATGLSIRRESGSMLDQQYVSSINETRRTRDFIGKARADSKYQTPSLFETTTMFISYRRDDSQDVVGRIYDRLVAVFSPEQVIRDIDSLLIGRPFPEALNDAVSQSEVVLVIIGKHWLTASDNDGARRLDDAGDFVRMEIERALAAGKHVVPVLVSNASMPLAKDLPESIRSLVNQHGIQVRPDPDFHGDMDRLIRQLGRVG